MSEAINELVNGVISTKKLEGAETFKNAESSGLPAADILDYWSWAYSEAQPFQTGARCSQHQSGAAQALLEFLVNFPKTTSRSYIIGESIKMYQV